MKNNSRPKLTVVGAGPGDPDLITVKGIKALKQANVVLYDALANVELLKYAPSHATKIFVGKRSGNHTYSQENINKLIVEEAYAHGHVVRLKGGDPFIFGRGFEELEYANFFGLETAIVVGLSSSISVPGGIGIPLTKRGISESFWVLTGTTQSGKLSSDISLAAKSSATIVILMGMKKLPEIINIFQKEKKGNTPVGIIQNGSSSNEKIGIGNINSIEKIVEEKSLSSPAIIVVGEVVGKLHDLRHLVSSIPRKGNELKIQSN